MSLGIYIKFSSEQKKLQVVGILKKQGIVVSFLQIFSRLRYMKRIARKSRSDIQIYCFLIWSLALNYVFTVLHLFIYIYIYLQTQAKKITRKKTILATGLPKLGKI